MSEGPGPGKVGDGSLLVSEEMGPGTRYEVLGLSVSEETRPGAGRRHGPVGLSEEMGPGTGYEALGLSV